MSPAPVEQPSLAVIAGRLRDVASSHSGQALSGADADTLKLAADLLSAPEQVDPFGDDDLTHEIENEQRRRGEAYEWDSFCAGWQAARRRGVSREQHAALALTMGAVIAQLTDAVQVAAASDPDLAADRIAELSRSRDLIHESRQEERLKRIALARVIESLPHAPDCATQVAAPTGEPLGACSCGKAATAAARIAANEAAYETAAQAFDEGRAFRSDGSDPGESAPNPYRAALAQLRIEVRA